MLPILKGRDPRVVPASGKTQVLFRKAWKQAGQWKDLVMGESFQKSSQQAAAAIRNSLESNVPSTGRELGSDLVQEKGRGKKKSELIAGVPRSGVGRRSRGEVGLKEGGSMNFLHERARGKASARKVGEGDHHHRKEEPMEYIFDEWTGRGRRAVV